MQKGFKILNLRSAMSLGLMAAGLITGFAVAGLAVTGMVVTGRPGRADQEALSPFVQRRVGDLGATNPCLCRDCTSPQPLPGPPGNVEFAAGCLGSQHHSAGFGD